MLLALSRSRLVLQNFDPSQVGDSSLAFLTMATWLTHVKPLRDDSTVTDLVSHASVRREYRYAHTSRTRGQAPRARRARASMTHSTPHNTTRRDRHAARTAWHTTTLHAANTVRHAGLRLVYTCADIASRGYLPPLMSSDLRAYKLDAERDVNERPSGWGWTGRALGATVWLSILYIGFVFV